MACADTGAPQRACLEEVNPKPSLSFQAPGLSLIPQLRTSTGQGGISMEGEAFPGGQ